MNQQVDNARTAMESFKELREFICESERGQVFDSLIAVEIGLDHYEAFWDAHCDMNPGLTFDAKVAGFISDIFDYIGFEGNDIDALLSAVADD